jgi:transcription elongation factor S-II
LDLDLDSMASSTQQLVGTVRKLQSSLVKASENSDDHIDRIQDLLQRLGELPITIEVLTETLIGKDVAKLRQSSNDSIVNLAKSLVTKWKKVAAAAASPSAASAPVRRDSNAGKAAAKPAQQPYNPSDEWNSIVPIQRQKICEKLYEVLILSKKSLTATSKNEEDEKIQEFLPTAAKCAVAIEAAVTGLRLSQDAYNDKVRSLLFNLKKNNNLRNDVLLQHTSSTALVQMSSEQLADDQTVAARIQESQKLQESKRLDWEQANEGKINEMCGITGELLKASLFTCNRCKSTKTTSTQKQTRSADEPMTVFVYCTNCGKRWKC